MRDRAALAAAVLLGLFAAARGLIGNDLPDLFIYRAGAALALGGESPYHLAPVRELVAAQFPDPHPSPTSLVTNCGFFLPPAAVLLFAPFAALPWTPAKLLWAVLTGVAGWAVARSPDLFRRPGDTPPSLVGRLLPFALLLNPLVAAVLVVGQTSLIAAGCAVFGLMAFARNRPTLGTLLWAVPFVKPHLALPLIPLAWFLGGWKRAAGLVAVVAGLNLAGAALIGPPLDATRDYLDFLPAARSAVLYNRAELNPQITSWNRALFAAGGPLVELTAATTLAGSAVWLGLVLVRCRRGRPSPAWATAAAAVGGLLCCQVLGYELVGLVLVVPWVRDLFADGHRLRGWLAVGLLAGQLLPAEVIGPARPFGVALLAALVLAGPVRPAAGRSPGAGTPAPPPPPGRPPAGFPGRPAAG